jgi:hypothetical protein
MSPVSTSGKEAGLLFTTNEIRLNSIATPDERQS